MPEIDGVELCLRLRGSAATADPPIVVVSGSDATQMEQAKAAGCDAVLAKPCSLTELVATIRGLLENSPIVPPPE